MNLIDQGQAAINRAVVEWHAWPTAQTDAPARTAAMLRYVHEGALDQRATMTGYQWCGAFAAYCWREIHPLLRQRLFPSVYRLQLFAQYRFDANLWPYKELRVPGGEWQQIRRAHASLGGERLSVTFRNRDGQGAVAQTGDIVLVGEDRPHHIALVAGNWAKGLVMISGNGWGFGPNGGKAHAGVVRNEVPWEQIHWLIRPAPADMMLDVEYR